ncbi:hypothetical protein M2447_000576 [Ereboglobus sp. PH5-10]|uniref:hypothetical protein n=1 Tax=Ereboglobus sp. PH5-10 TaxID=2940629 RepID=UPI002406A430|nr:hypothetical protein [Ereboglobus sp. PH5-10]MDF9826495.1 hypothetical protein [Ereboglobus sp. PH5-10]
MHSFSEQCLEMARTMLAHNLTSIQPEGTILPVEGEHSRPDEPGHAALALGEYYRATGATTLKGYDLVDLTARCITAQMFTEPAAENGLAYASLGLLCFGPSKERNLVWERLVDETRARIDKQLLHRSDYDNHWQAFNVAKAVARFSFGLSKKDETSRLIERMVERINATSSTGFFDDAAPGIGGNFSLYGVMTYVFIRSSLQLHANSGVRDRKLPTLRTYAEKYIKMMPDLVRADGLGWAFGRYSGAYGQMHCISLILQGLRDGWIAEDQKPKYFDILRRLFLFFYQTYLDQEHGFLDMRDNERTANQHHTTRIANFDAARFLCQWSRLAKTVQMPAAPIKPEPVRTNPTGRFVIFDKSNRKEQGLFLYRDPTSGIQAQIPLVSSSKVPSADTLPFPHCPGVFDWPCNVYAPIMLPELTFDDTTVTIPAYYGKNCVTGLGLRNSFYFRYEQPELITKDEELTKNIGSVKVQWNFAGPSISCEFAYTVKQQVTLTKFRYMLAIAAPHSRYRVAGSLALGEQAHRCTVQKDDFQASWQETEVVTDDPNYCTNYGKIHYLQSLVRDHPLIMRPGNIYRLIVNFEPDVTRIEE